MTVTPRHAAYGLCALLAALALLWGLGSWQQRHGAQWETQSAIHQGEANAHVSQAQAIPDHSQELAEAKAAVARARAEVERVKRLLAAKPGHAVPDPAGSGSALPPSVDPDPRDAVIASQGVLIEKQEAQIKGLELALLDEGKRSSEWKAAFDAERKATAAQAAATEAWKKAVTTSRWRGRVEGFVAGAALGYVARGQR